MLYKIPIFVDKLEIYLSIDKLLEMEYPVKNS
jgi:hypothetical protein